MRFSVACSPTCRDDPPAAGASGSNPPEIGADDDSCGRWTAPPVVHNVTAPPVVQEVTSESREPKAC